MVYPGSCLGRRRLSTTRKSRPHYHQHFRHFRLLEELRHLLELGQGLLELVQGWLALVRGLVEQELVEEDQAQEELGSSSTASSGKQQRLQGRSRRCSRRLAS